MQFVVEMEARQCKRRYPISPQSIPQGFAIVRQHGDLKIVLLSVDANDAAAAKEAGAAFIHKGASPDELIATLTPLLRKE